MKDTEKNREQLLGELAALRQRVATLEASREDYQRASYESWSQLAKDQLLIARIGQIISSTLDIDEVYDRFAREVSNLVHFDRISINIIDQGAGVFTIKYLAGQEVEGRHIGAIRNIRGTQTEYLLSTGQTIVRDDLNQVQEFETDPAFVGEGLRSGIMVPLVSKGQIFGSLSLRSKLAGAYGHREQGILEQLAQHIAPAIENSELYQRTRQAEEALRLSQEVERRLAAEDALLAETRRIITSTLNIDEVYERFAQETRRLIDFDRMSINLVDHDSGTFTFRYVSGLVQPGRQVPDTVPLPGTQTEYVSQTGQSLVRPDVASNPTFRGDRNLLGAGMRSSIMVPLKTKGQVIGTWSLRSSQAGLYGNREQVLLERLADQIASAIENAELYARARRAEEDLRESEEQYRILFEQSREAIFLASPEGQILGVNQSAVELFGYSLQELMDLEQGEFWVNPDEKARWNLEIQGKGSIKDMAIKLRHKDGTERDCIITSNLLRDNNGQVLGTQCVVRDVTERKRWEQALQESEQRFRYLVENATDAFFVFDRDGHLVDVNQRSCEMLGYTKEELLQLTVWDLRADQTEPTWPQLWERLIPGIPITVERLYRRKDGTTFSVENCIGQVEMQGEPCLFSITRDITERKQTEQTLLEQTRDLAVAEERNRLARELHDSVTQSIYSLTLFSETARQLVSVGNTERLEYYLARLGQTGQQALKEMRLLVHELRPLQLEHEGLVGALQQRLDSVEQRAGIDGCLLTEGNLDIPPSCEFELYRVAQEALNNSLKHAFATAVTVRLTTDGQMVRMEVQDNGKGFELETSDAGGGMGLVNMRHRVQSMGGELMISSQADVGTTVEVMVNYEALGVAHGVTD